MHIASQLSILGLSCNRIKCLWNILWSSALLDFKGCRGQGWIRILEALPERTATTLSQNTMQRLEIYNSDLDLPQPPCHGSDP
jgi:hypothetical protein